MILSHRVNLRWRNDAVGHKRPNDAIDFESALPRKRTLRCVALTVALG
jgi:hypothetical protein